LRAVRGAAAGTPLLVGSGATADNVAKLLDIADGVIVGSSLKRGPVTEPVDAELAAAFVIAAG
jgi:predicted TIM-barrel enzyme